MHSFAMEFALMSKTISRQSILACLCGFLAAVALSAGCGRTSSGPAPLTFDINDFNSGWCDWGPAPGGEKSLTAGIDLAHIHYVTWKDKVAFLLWSDLGVGISWGNLSTSSGSDAEYVRTGHINDPDFLKIEYELRTPDGKTGSVTVNGQKMDLSQGWLILVSVRGGKLHIKQLQREALNATPPLQGHPEVLDKLKMDPEIVAFFAGKKR
jgi:hypothetical protein